METLLNNSNTKSETYCSHYERDTCVMHFRCCPEDKWYPCHKCHNEAVEKEHDKTKDLTAANDTPRGVSTIPTERSFSEAEENIEPEDLQVHEEERNGENLFAENPNDPESNEVTGTGDLAADGNGHVAAGGSHEESDSLVPKDASPSLPAEPKTIYSVASVTDANPLRSTACGQEPELQNLVAEGETGSGNVATDGNGHVAEETHYESDSLAPNDSSPSSPAEPKTIHSVASATDATQLRCTGCGQEQQFSDKCQSCGKSFAQYFCDTCKLLIEKNVDAYHCDKCGICRGNKADHFHCDECNVCMSQSLKDNHKCFSDRGHDPCAICYEDVFSGAIIFPCFHMIHKECAERLLLSGSRTCPMCRYEIFQNGEDRIPAEDPGEDERLQNPPSRRSLREAAWAYPRALIAYPKALIANVLKHLCKSSNNAPMQRNIPLNQGTEMNNLGV